MAHWCNPDDYGRAVGDLNRYDSRVTSWSNRVVFSSIDVVSIGTTRDNGREDTQPTAEDHKRIYEQSCEMLPSLQVFVLDITSQKLFDYLEFMLGYLNIEYSGHLKKIQKSLFWFGFLYAQEGTIY